MAEEFMLGTNSLIISKLASTNRLGEMLGPSTYRNLLPFQTGEGQVREGRLAEMYLMEAVAQLVKTDGGPYPEHCPQAPGDDVESLFRL